MYTFKKLLIKQFLAHGSALSLISTGSSSLYSGMGTDEKQAQEVRRLRRDLNDAQDKVHTLTSQLSTNVSIKIKILIFVFIVNFIFFMIYYFWWTTIVI